MTAGIAQPAARSVRWRSAARIATRAAGRRSSGRQQRLLSSAAWDETGVREDVRGWAVAALADQDAVLVADNTGFPKKNRRSAGVQRQYPETAGRIEKCRIGSSWPTPPGRVGC
jgi:SRSO17 transposase